MLPRLLLAPDTRPSIQRWLYDLRQIGLALRTNQQNAEEKEEWRDNGGF